MNVKLNDVKHATRVYYNLIRMDNNFTKLKNY